MKWMQAHLNRWLTHGIIRNLTPEENLQALRKTLIGSSATYKKNLERMNQHPSGSAVSTRNIGLLLIDAIKLATTCRIAKRTKFYRSRFLQCLALNVIWHDSAVDNICCQFKSNSWRWMELIIDEVSWRQCPSALNFWEFRIPKQPKYGPAVLLMTTHLTIKIQKASHNHVVENILLIILVKHSPQHKWNAAESTCDHCCKYVINVADSEVITWLNRGKWQPAAKLHQHLIVADHITGVSQYRRNFKTLRHFSKAFSMKANRLTKCNYELYATSFVKAIVISPV